MRLYSYPQFVPLKVAHLAAVLEPHEIATVERFLDNGPDLAVTLRMAPLLNNLNSPHRTYNLLCRASAGDITLKSFCRVV